MITIGSRIKYIREDNTDDKSTGYYPPIGTRGTVIDSYSDGNIEVRWDKGTKGEGIWWCFISDVEEVQMNDIELLAEKLMNDETLMDLTPAQCASIAETVIKLGYKKEA